MNEQLQAQILSQLNNSTAMVTNAKTFQLADLLESHPDLPHCERYVVDLINSIKQTIKGANYSISKSELLNIYQKHRGIESANEMRTDEIMSKLSTR
jgi:hypothetical protein